LAWSFGECPPTSAHILDTVSTDNAGQDIHWGQVSRELVSGETRECPLSVGWVQPTSRKARSGGGLHPPYEWRVRATSCYLRLNHAYTRTQLYKQNHAKVSDTALLHRPIFAMILLRLRPSIL
jgi:hypothetical protein